MTDTRSMIIEHQYVNDQLIRSRWLMEIPSVQAWYLVDRWTQREHRYNQKNLVQKEFEVLPVGYERGRELLLDMGLKVAA